MLVAGSREGLPEEWPLSFAVRDAERFARVMNDLGDVPSERTTVLRDPTVSEFVAALHRTAEKLEPKATLLVYYSGHGSEAALHMRGQKLPLRDVRRELDRHPATLRLVVIDACRGGVAAKGFVPRNRSASRSANRRAMTGRCS